MNELITISENQNGLPSVSGRELHKFLGIETQYSIWFQRMLNYGFDTGKDYELLVNQKRLTNNSKNHRLQVGFFMRRRGVKFNERDVKIGKSLLKGCYYENPKIMSG